MQGLWLVIVTKDHRRVFDPNIGPLKNEDYQIGEVVKPTINDKEVFKAFEGDIDEGPTLEGLAAKEYRWLFFAGIKLADLESIGEYVRIVDDHVLIQKNPGYLFKKHAKTIVKRSIIDKLLGRRKWL